MFQRLTWHSTRNISLWKLSDQIRSFSSESMEKIPKISEDLFDIIDQHDTRFYNKRKNKAKYQIEQFGLYRKKQVEEMLQQPDKYHPVIYKLLSAETGEAIMDTLEGIDKTEFGQEECIKEDEDDDTKYLTPTIHQIYARAIRCCADLDELNLCWKIFENCKKDQILSNELYNTMMWVCMYKRRSPQILEQVLGIKKELDQVIIDHNLKPHPRTYSTLINSCMKVRNLDEGYRTYREIERFHPELFGYTRIVQASVKLLATLGERDKALKLIESKAKSDETVWCQFKLYELPMIVRKMGLQVKYGGIGAEQCIEKAEKLFQKCVATACRHNVDIPVAMFNAIMKVYAQNGGYDSCFVLLQYMIHPGKKRKNYPSPSLSSFESILEALMHHENSDEKWEKVDKMLMAMKKLGIEKTWNFYCRLLVVCDDDIERARKWYHEMIDVDGIEPVMAVLDCYFDVAAKHYNSDDPEFETFVRYLIDEYSKYDIIPTEEIKHRWEVALYNTRLNASQTK